MLYNVYCDESCHLEHDRQEIMLLGSVWCPANEVDRINNDVKELKEKYRSRGELKWIKVSHSRSDFFVDVIKYFFNNDKLHYRGVIVLNKKDLDHSYYNQGSHDTYYYKMYYFLIKNILDVSNTYDIYFDIKDTRSQGRIEKLREILCNRIGSDEIVRKIQHVRAREIGILQLTDFITGAISYSTRGLHGNSAKLAVVDIIKQTLKTELKCSTPPWEEKFNLLFFSPRKRE